MCVYGNHGIVSDGVYTTPKFLIITVYRNEKNLAEKDSEKHITVSPLS